MIKYLTLVSMCLLLLGCVQLSEEECLKGTAEEVCSSSQCKVTGLVNNNSGYEYWASGSNEKQQRSFTKKEYNRCEGGRLVLAETRW